jgi:hypothetical protein
VKSFYWLALVTLGLCAGCKGKTEQKAAEDAAPLTSLFKAGKGVLLCEESKGLLGIEMAEVEEKPVQHSIERTAQVYRSGKPGCRAGAVSLIRTGEAKELKTGQPVMLRDTAGREMTGNLVLLDVQTEAALGAIEALIEFDDFEGKIEMGAFVKATFNQGGPTLSIVARKSALLSGAEGDSVYTVNGTHLTRTRVKAGMTQGDNVEIRDGLYAGDVVACKGVEGLWAVELSALKGGTPCCPVPKK